MRPLVNDLDPNRPPARKKPVIDPLEKSLLAMEEQDEMNLKPEDHSSSGVIDFEYIKKLAKSIGVDIGIRLDESLLASVNNDPDKYIEIRSNPQKYDEFKKSIQSGSEDKGSGSIDKQKQPAKKTVTTSSMPASQAQPPRQKR